MSETSPDSTEVIETPLAVAEPATGQELSQEPVSEDAADSTENSEVVKSRAQQRIEQLVAEKNQLLQDKKHAIEFANINKDRYDAVVASNVPKVEPVQLVVPTLEDCDFDEVVFGQKTQEYYGQLIDQRVNEATSKAISESSRQAAQAKLDADWTKRVQAYKAENPDFDKEAFATEGIYGVIKNDPQGPRIAHELGKNPAEAQRIGLLNGMEQAMAIGEFKSKLSAKPTVKTETTKAPPPMSTVGGSQPNLSVGNETTEDFMARRNAEMAEKRGARR